jgi:acetyl-CoA acetyltransferase
VGRGHPVGATGLCQLVEVVTQLRGRAGHRQVEGARLGAAVNCGGVLGPDVAWVNVTVVEAAERP